MASPFSLFRKNQKLMIAGLGVLCMLAFLVLPVLMEDMGGGERRNPVVLSTSQGEIRQQEMDNMLSERQTVNRFLTELIRQTARAMSLESGSNPQLEAYIGNQLVRQLQQQGLLEPPSEEGAVETMLLVEKGKDLDITISNATINDFLRSTSQDKVTQQQIRSIIDGMGITTSGLFDALRKDLIARQVRVILSSSITTSTPGMTFDYFCRFNTKVRGEVVPVAVADFVDQIEANPSDSELKSLYERYKLDYPQPGSPEPGFHQPQKAKFQYLLAKIDDYVEVSEVTDADIEQYYETHKDRRYLVPVPPSAMNFNPAQNTPPAEKPPAETAPEESTPSDTAPDETAPSESKPEESSEEASPASETEAAPEESSETPAETPSSQEGESPEEATSNTSQSEPAAPETTDPAAPEGASRPEPETPSSPEPPGNGAGPEEFAQDPTATDSEPAAPSDETPEPDSLEPETPEPETTQPETPETEPTASETTESETAEPAKTPPESASTEEAATDASQGDPRPPLDMGMQITGEYRLPMSLEDYPSTKFWPLWLIRNLVRTDLQNDRESAERRAAQDKIVERFGQISRKLETYELDLARYEAKVEKAKDNNTTVKESESPKPPSLKAFAQEYGFEPHETKLHSADEMERLTELGKTFVYTGRENDRNDPFVSVAYSGLHTFVSRRAEDLKGNQYLFWKVEETEDNVPAFKDIRDKVVRVWKFRNARPLAEKRASELAAKASSSGQSLKEVFARDSAITVTETGQFSWMTFGSAGAAMMGFSPPTLGEAEGVVDPGPDFMRTATQLDPGQIAVAWNNPQTIYYVVRISEKSPDNDALVDSFVEEASQQDGLTRYARAAFPEQRSIYTHWITQLQDDAKVVWERPPGRRQ